MMVVQTQMLSDATTSETLSLPTQYRLALKQETGVAVCG